MKERREKASAGFATPPSRFAVIADGTTGALDTGAQCVTFGIRTTVILDTGGIEESGVGALGACGRGACFVFDSDSRRLDAGDGRARVSAVASFAHRFQLPIVYKKVDSTLRGNIAAEISALAGAFDGIVFAPELPEAGRVCVDEEYLIGGLPIARTEFASGGTDESSRLASLFDHAERLIPVPTTAGALAERLSCRPDGEGTPVYVCDAAARADLDRIAAAVVESGANLLPAGSAGLFLSWLRRTLDRHAPRVGFDVPGPVLIVAGSTTAATRRQIERVRTLCRVIEARPGDAGTAGDIFDALDGGGHVCVVTIGFDRGAMLPVASASAKVRPGTIVLTGGWTARRVFDAVGARAVVISGEYAPLVPAGVVVGGFLDGVRVITKAGGFGGDDLFERILCETNRFDLAARRDRIG